MRGTCLALSVLLSGAAWAQTPLDPYAPQTAQPIVVPTPPPPVVVQPPQTPYVPEGPYVPPPVPPPASPFDASDGCNECSDPQPYVRPYLPQPYPPFPQRPVARPDSRRVRLIAGGITLFATSWVSATIDAAFGTTPYVIIPLAGPIIATVDYQRNYVHTGSLQLESVLLVFDAAAQTAGLIMTIVGASMKPRPPGAVRVSWAGTGVRGTF